MVPRTLGKASQLGKNLAVTLRHSSAAVSEERAFQQGATESTGILGAGTPLPWRGTDL